MVLLDTLFAYVWRELWAFEPSIMWEYDTTYHFYEGCGDWPQNPTL